MKFPDLLIMSMNNLRRRKLRTVLTVLGVIIGTAAIVVMVSLGIGLNEMTMEQIASWGSLTTIEVYSQSSDGGMQMMGAAMSSQNSESEPNYITDKVIDNFKRIPHVTGVSPVLNMNVVMRQGAYISTYVQLKGVSQSYLEQLELAEGRLPQPGELGLVFGNGVIRDFTNAKTGKGYWDTGEMPDVDPMGKPMFVIFDMDAYYQSQGSGSSSDGTPVKPPKKYMIETTGMLAGGENGYSNYSWYVFTDIDGLKAQLKKVFKKGTPIPGQPTNKKGKPLNELVYNSAEVFVDDMENVTQVQEQLAAMGYQVNSQMDFLESSRQQSNMVQAVLGGIGAVSLFVAAIGIANTMMMSIYERTKEIGVMKVLGCDMGNIRNMFLIESGFIGFMGGTIGVALSYGVSAIVNRFVNMSQSMGLSGDLSRIPPWLSMAAIGFAVFVGMAAGFMPAVRAMKLSPLAAIRNE
ncbi:ABC transporter permease [Enterocloster sp. HCN-30185]|uniref:ABC transporter permease n=1 Tax=Enterocloster sp. HCN-30185 TaxID=3134663 RepID=UPI0030BC2A74